MFDYWNTIRGVRPAPLRADIAPAAIAKTLPSTFILQNNAAQKYEFRLAGTALCLMFGNELKQIEFCDLLERDDRNLMERTIIAVIEENICALAQFDATFGQDKHLTMELLLLPLADNQPRILGTLHMLELPLWAENEEVADLKFKELRILDADVELFALHNRPAIGLKNRAPGSASSSASTSAPKKHKRRFAVLQGGGASKKDGTDNNLRRLPHKPKLKLLDGGKDPIK